MKTKTVLPTRLRNLALAGSLLWFVSFAQPILVLSQETFHVVGKVADYRSNGIVGAEVKFEGSKTTTTVTSDKQGSYSAELPVGSYSMTVATGSPGRTEYYRRPIFRVSSPKTIVLDVTLGGLVRSCDPGHLSVTRPDETTETTTDRSPDDLRDLCGGWDRFPIFSDKGGSFELFVRYFSRRRSDGMRTYDGGFHNPVFVAFNLFTLTADHVTYDTANRTLLASGNVVVANGSSHPQHATSIKFRIEDIRVLRVSDGKMRPLG